MVRDCNGSFIGDFEADKVTKKRRFFTSGFLEKTKCITGPVSLLVALMIYTAVGGLVFQQLELPSELARLSRVRAVLLTRRNYLVNRILNSTDLSNLANMIRIELRSYETAVQEAAQGGFLITLIDEIESFQDQDIADLAPVVTERWSILQAIFFASTVLTTIGYGNVVPATNQGKIFCIFFAFVGIPLTLTVIADWGKLFAETVSNMTAGLRTRLPGFFEFCTPSNIVRRRYLGAFAAAGLLFLYLSCGAAMFMLWEEDWAFFDGFYFCFVTMTTIGFGDLVPKKPKYMLLCTLYILVGLALTGTIIELVRRQYAESWQRLQALRGPLANTLKKLSEQANGDMTALQSDLRKVLAVVSMPRFRRRDGRETLIKDTEWEDAVQAIIRDVSETKPSTDQQKPILQFFIYESSV